MLFLNRVLLFTTNCFLIFERHHYYLLRLLVLTSSGNGVQVCCFTMRDNFCGGLSVRNFCCVCKRLGRSHCHEGVITDTTLIQAPVTQTLLTAVVADGTSFFKTSTVGLLWAKGITGVITSYFVVKTKISIVSTGKRLESKQLSKWWAAVAATTPVTITFVYCSIIQNSNRLYI